jgi:hypothetical protein
MVPRQNTTPAGCRRAGPKPPLSRGRDYNSCSVIRLFRETSLPASRPVSRFRLTGTAPAFTSPPPTLCFVPAATGQGRRRLIAVVYRQPLGSPRLFLGCGQRSDGPLNYRILLYSNGGKRVTRALSSRSAIRTNKGSLRFGRLRGRALRERNRNNGRTLLQGVRQRRDSHPACYHFLIE